MEIDWVQVAAAIWAIGQIIGLVLGLVGAVILLIYVLMTRR